VVKNFAPLMGVGPLAELGEIPNAGKASSLKAMLAVEPKSWRRVMALLRQK
jgi:hypothetical protein